MALVPVAVAVDVVTLPCQLYLCLKSLEGLGR
jgi:hypothetical protein